MKRLLCLCCCLAVVLTCLPACGSSPQDSDRLTVVATLFPQYDFARAIAGDRAEITLLLPPGVESHSFDPTPADIMTIQKADLFLTTGPQMEPWADRLAESLQSPRTLVDLSQGISLSSPHAGEPGHMADPHLWTSPQNAKIMVNTILEALCRIDPQGEEAYRENAQNYQGQLDLLDAEFRQIASTASRRTLAFSGRFALHYFVEEYGLEAVSALPSCSGESEPSAAAVATVIDTVRSQHLPVVYHEELTDPKVGRSIAQSTGAKLLLFHSCHNVSREEWDAKATYLSLMKQNAEHLKAGLCQ